MWIIFGFTIFSRNSGHGEENLRPELSSDRSFSIFHLNLKSNSLWNDFKLSLLRVYLSTHKSDVICIFETYFYYDTSHEDANQEIGYTLIRDNYPSNTKRGGTCIYNRHSLASQLLNIQYLGECTNFEILF